MRGGRAYRRLTIHKPVNVQRALTLVRELLVRSIGPTFHPRLPNIGRTNVLTPLVSFSIIEGFTALTVTEEVITDTSRITAISVVSQVRPNSATLTRHVVASINQVQRAIFLNSPYALRENLPQAGLLHTARLGAAVSKAKSRPVVRGN